MAEKVKLSKDGSSIDFVQSDSLPTSVKKFRQSPEIEGFYRFCYENDLQKEAHEILERIINARKAKKMAEKLQARLEKKEAAKAEIQKTKVEKTPTVKANKTPTAKIEFKTAKPIEKMAKSAPAKIPAKPIKAVPVKAAAKPLAKLVKSAAKAKPADKAKGKQKR